MVKWEYLMLWLWQFGGEKCVSVEPAGRVRLQWLVQQYPKTKADVDGDLNADRLRFGSPAEWSTACHSLIDYLCSEGWEPFAATGAPRNQTLHFQRQLAPAFETATESASREVHYDLGRC
jgi:hypothetical protein